MLRGARRARARAGAGRSTRVDDRRAAADDSGPPKPERAHRVTRLPVTSLPRCARPGNVLVAIRHAGAGARHVGPRRSAQESPPLSLARCLQNGSGTSPRLHSNRHRTEMRASTSRKKLQPHPARKSGLPKSQTGIQGLDAIADGGLPTGRPTLVCGSAGCGKTLLAVHFLVHGALTGEPGVFMAFEETAEDPREVRRERHRGQLRAPGVERHRQPNTGRDSVRHRAAG